MSDEYVPSDTQVKIDFIAGNPATPVKDAAGAFDRWLTEHDRRVADAEAERVAAWLDTINDAHYAAPDDPENADFTIAADVRRGAHRNHEA